LAIDVQGKQDNVQQQAGYREGSDQLFVALQSMEKIIEAVEAELPEIVAIKTQYRNNQSKKNAVDKIVFFQDFHV
jgi:UDP-N-acetylglucosamine pyrophosphorylase